MHHHDDPAIHDLLHRAMPLRPSPGGLSAVRAAAARRARRRRWAMATSGVVAALLTAGVASLARGDDPVATSAPPPAGEVVRRVDGISAELRLSAGTAPIRGFEAFGSVAVGDSRITAGTQTVDSAGRPLALLVVTAGPTTSAIRVAPVGGSVVEVPSSGSPIVVVVPLAERSARLVLVVDALRSDGASAGSVRVTPFDQVPLSCATSIDQVGSHAMADPTFVPALQAYLTGPIPPRCDG